MKIIPLSDRVLVEVEAMDEITPGGLYIPQIAQEKTQTGTVIAVGNDREVIRVEVNQRVMYDKYAGTALNNNDKECILLRMNDIFAVIE